MSLLAFFYWATLCVVVYLVPTNANGVTSHLYQEEPICGVRELLDNFCFSLTGTSSRTRVQCAVLCQGGNSSTCQDFVMGKNGSCYLRQSNSVDESSLSCSQEDYFYVRYRRVDSSNIGLATHPCFNHGVFDALTRVCRCVDAWVGTYCERRPVTCQELRQFGYPLGEYLADLQIQPNLIAPTAKVKCELGGSFTNTYVSVSSGQNDLNATFEQYKNGFYVAPDAFWMGLDNIRILNMAGLGRLVVSVHLGAIILKSVYNSVVVAGEDQAYRLTYSSVIIHGNTGLVFVDECLATNVKFSAWDRDNDQENGRNLASEAGSGWWFRDLGLFCNPNGQAPTNASHGVANQLQFVAVPGADLSFNALGKDFEKAVFYFYEAFP